MPGSELQAVRQGFVFICFSWRSNGGEFTSEMKTVSRVGFNACVGL